MAYGNVLYDSPFQKRRLRILNALFLTLSRQGHDASSDRQDHHTEFRAIIGDTRIVVTLDEAGRKPDIHNCYTAPRPDPKRSASVKLRLTVRNAFWEDDAAGTLESKIAEITGGLIVKGARAYRDHLRGLEEQAERERVAAEQRRQERPAKATADRSAALIKSGRLLAEAENLRSLTARVAIAVADGRLDMSPAQLC
jgi:hypothetical protein